MLLLDVARIFLWGRRRKGKDKILKEAAERDGGSEMCFNATMQSLNFPFKKSSQK